MSSSEEDLRELAAELRKPKRPVHDSIAKLLRTKWTFKTMRDTGDVLIYRDGLYVPGESAVVEATEGFLQKLRLGEKATNQVTNEVLGHIRRSTGVNRDEFNSLPDLLNLNNGVLNLRTRKLIPHSPDMLFTVRVPLTYDPEADCPLVRRFLSEIVSPEDIPLLEEIFGWCLWYDSRIQRLILLVGSGANGKSTLLGLLMAFLGTSNCSSVRLQSFATNRFAAAELYGKSANISADLPSIALTDTGMVKMLTGGDPVYAERKFQPPFTFINRAKMIFAVNQPPSIPDESLAMWRRIVVVDFPHQFLGSKADAELGRKLTNPNELSGLLNVALRGLDRLRENDDFSYEASWKKTRDWYTLVSDPIQAFYEDGCIRDSDSGPDGISLSWLSRDELYKAYVAYCRENKASPVSKKKFGREIRKRKLATDGQHEGVHGWLGLRLAEQSD